MRIDIFGLTFAETALVLLFGVFAALLAGKAEENRVLSEAKIQQEHMATMQASLDAEKQRSASLSRKLESLAPKLRSSVLPSCAETGLTQGWLFTATVKSSDSYEIDGASLNLSKLLEVYSAQLQQASGAECRERIRLYVGEGISGADYEYALRRISQYFYVAYMGSR